MKLGSLFDGIAGFPLAASRYGITPAWSSEIEAFPMRVSAHHFPEMMQLGDVTQIDGTVIEPVDVITFGSPCQDLSVAGKRGGLEGERSGLFMDAIRIIRDMRHTTGGRYPRFAVWENVPGALSSNAGEDFRAVLGAITGVEIPMPASGRWAAAGMVRTGDCECAWRVLDAQYWGVPQRRRRIFLVADFTGRSAAKILFKREGLYGDITESGEAGQRTAADAGECIAFNGRQDPVSGPVNRNDGSPCIDRGPEMVVVYPDVTGTICASGAGTNRPAGQGNELDMVIAFENRHDEGVRLMGDKCNTLCGREKGGGFDKHMVATKRTVPQVRRLTPLECERLQGFPDGWTDILGASDTARYKALGNSVAIPCVEFIVQGIAEELRKERSVAP